MSIANYEYITAGVNQSFVDNPTCQGCSGIIIPEKVAWTYGNDFPNVVDEKISHLHQLSREGRLERLENVDCIDSYARMIQSNRGSVLLVTQFDVKPELSTKWLTSSSPLSWMVDSRSAPREDPYQWICGTSTDCAGRIDEVRDSAINWTIMGSNVQYCLSEKIESECTIRWSQEIGVIVVALNLFKAILMVCTLLSIEEEPLMAMGDAIASFLQRPDPTTVNMCLASRTDVMAKHNFNPGPRRWAGKTYRWRHSTSRSRRAFTYLL